MSASELFLESTLSVTEQTIIAEAFGNPAIKKYLRIMALEDTKELLTFSAISHTDQEIAKAMASVQGKLSVFSTLLSIQSPQSTKE